LEEPGTDGSFFDESREEEVVGLAPDVDDFEIEGSFGVESSAAGSSGAG